jgi:hypothetical protein
VNRKGRFSIAAALTVLSLVLHTGAASADTPAGCLRANSDGFCIEWGTGDPGHGGGSGGQGGNNPGGGVVCYWVNLPAITDPTIFADYGLDYPPPGATIQWQEYQCSDGSGTFPIRWVFPPSPGQTATEVRARLEGRLPAPVIAASPAVGTASIVSVPVFVSVTNWGGAVTDSGCAGAVCVTVTATPTLRFSPGEPGAAPVACAGGGSLFDPARDPKTQATAPGACVYSYRQRTGVSSRPAAWPGVVAVSWTISWRANTGETGTLASVVRSTALPRSVQEVQTVIVGGSNP